MERSNLRFLRVLLLVVVVALGIPAIPALGQSVTNQRLTTGGTIIYAPGDGAVVIDPDLTISGSEQAPLDAALVSITSGFRPGQDTLGIDGQTGTDGTVDTLAWAYNSAAGVLTLSGQATVGDYQAALRQVTFSNSSSNELAIDRSVSISLGAVVYHADNGHFYEFVSAPRISWADAKSAAEARTHAGLPGYLATLTAAEENDVVTDKLFVTDMPEDADRRLIGRAWIGASDEGHDKEWRWETGPEAGTHFFSQAADEEGCGQGAAETQPAGDHYTNWEPTDSEPNDWPDGCADNENFGYITTNGRWNDWPDSSNRQALGYVVEYGGIGGTTTAPVGTILIRAPKPSISIERTWLGDDPQLASSYTIIPEVDDCTAEQTVLLAADQASVDVEVLDQVAQVDCTYTVAVTAPVGYTASPDEVTAVAIDGTAAFTNTAAPADALPRTGSTNRQFVILGLALAGTGWFVLGGGRRRQTDGDDDTDVDDAEIVDLLPNSAWTEHATALTHTPASVRAHDDDPTDMHDDPTDMHTAAGVVHGSDHEPDDDPGSVHDADGGSANCAFEAAVAPLQPQREPQPPALMDNTPDAADEPQSKPEVLGAHGIVEDLLQLLEDLAED